MLLDAVPRGRLPPGAWDAFVERHPAGWFWHSERWIDYCLAYRPGAVDRSFALVSPSGVVAVAPVVCEGREIAMGGNPCAAPLVDGPPSCFGIHECVAGEVGRRAERGLIARARWRAQPAPACPPFPLDLPALQALGCRDVSWETRVLPLGRTCDELALWMGLRKSYRQIIKRQRDSGRECAVTSNPWAVQVAHALHARAAGRETRPARTWDMMEAWARDGLGLVALSHPPGAWASDGFAYVIRWKRWAYFASAATLAPDVNHWLQWEIIRALHKDDRGCYELGWQARPGDSEKDRGISFFKRGFGGEDWLVPVGERVYG